MVTETEVVPTLATMELPELEAWRLHLALLWLYTRERWALAEYSAVTDQLMTDWGTSL